jgi:antitoxin HigA-1
MLPKNRAPTPPGEMLKEEFLEPVGLTQGRLAEALKIPIQRLNEIINGKRGVTPDTANRLSLYFGNSPEFWMNLQAAHDLWRAKQDMDASEERDIVRQGRRFREDHAA